MTKPTHMEVYERVANAGLVTLGLGLGLSFTSIALLFHESLVRQERLWQVLFVLISTSMTICVICSISCLWWWIKDKYR